MFVATFFLSTGRCGTQWIAKSLGDRYSDCLDIEHEPLHGEYDARKALGCVARGETVLALSPAVQNHVEAIERGLESRPYLECGHPNWSSIPLLAERLRGRVRIVHLTRHPVPTSFSWLTHNAFQTPLLPHIAEKILLSPNDEGIRFDEYRETWPMLSPFEKCLFYWAEVHALGIETQLQLDVPWLRLKYEDLFQSDGLERLLDFLGLPPRERVNADQATMVDKFHYLTSEQPDWKEIKAHPRIIEVARQLDYQLDEFDEDVLRYRYLA